MDANWGRQRDQAPPPRPSLNVLLMTMSLDFGGAETHVVSLAKALKREGLQVSVASNGGRLVSQLQAADIPHHRVALHARKPLQILHSIGLIKRLVCSTGCDLMHAHARIPAWVGQRVQRSTGVPLVTTYHGLYDDHWLLKLFTTPGRQTIAVSGDVKQHLVSRLGVPAKQVTVIHNGIDVDQFASDHSPSHPWRVTYISRLAGERGGVALQLLQAVRMLLPELEQLQAVIVGEGDRLAEVQALAADINRQAGKECCLVLGGRSDIPELMAEAGVVVGVGRVALEAMASGRPVIIAGEYGSYGLLNEQTLPLAIEHNFSGRGARVSTDADSLVYSLRKVFDQPRQASAAAAICRDLVISRYSVQKKAQEVLEIYHRALSASSARGNDCDR
ncbi:MAG: glycosyltransferase [Bacillota bacterium]|jgi:glycosyltransferase involved in cell wall biosynthesis